MFDELVESSAAKKRTNTRWTLILSTAAQVSVIGVLILIPLIYTEALPKQLLTTFLAAPPRSSPASSASRGCPAHRETCGSPDA